MKFSSKQLAVGLFIVILFFIDFADGIMSYFSPIFIESQVSSTLMMGIIFSFSSVVGTICDFLFPKWFHNQTHFFFLKITLIAALTFPFTLFFFPQHVVTMLLAMAIWGVYYELNMFSTFQFVHTYIHIRDHAKIWGILEAIRSLSYAIAPLLTASLLILGNQVVLMVVFILLGVAIFGAVLFRFLFVKKKRFSVNEQIPVKKSWITELKIWRVLFKKIWPLYILQLMIFILDATFWTIGTIFTQTLHDQSFVGGFFLTAYALPFLIFSFFAGKMAKHFSKKRLALLLSAASGLAFFTFSIIRSPLILVGMTFIAASFLALARPELKATFEDYVSRLGKKGEDMIGLQGSSMSIAFVVGPIFSSLVATFVGIQTTFAVIGLMLFLICLGLLIVTPKKIHMPQQVLEAALL